MFSLLAHPNFRLLWLGQLCSQFGDRLTQIVLVALVAQRASGSTMSLAAVFVITSLPALVLNPFAGAYVDRWDRKRTMIVCDLIRAAVILALPLFVREIPLFYGAVFVIFAVGSFFVPARLAIIPDLVPAGRLAEANALFTVSGMVGSTVILLVGALMVEWFGAARGCWVNAASYLASAAFLLPVARNRPRPARPAQLSSRIAHDILEGIRELWRHPETRRVSGLLGFLMAGAGASIVVGTVFVQQSLGSVTKDLGFLSLWMGVGMLAGSTAYGRWGTRLPRRAALGLAFLGCGVAVWAFVAGVGTLRSGIAASCAAAFLGFWFSPVGIIINTLVHEAHPERMHGRIFSSLGIIINLSWIGSMLAAGWLAERGDRAAIMAAIGAAFAASGVWMLVKPDRAMLKSSHS